MKLHEKLLFHFVFPLLVAVAFMLFLYGAGWFVVLGVDVSEEFRAMAGICIRLAGVFVFLFSSLMTLADKPKGTQSIGPHGTPPNKGTGGFKP